MDLKKVREELEELRIRMTECEETLEAFRSLNGDSPADNREEEIQSLTFHSDGYPYRMIIENMFEGAAILSPDLNIIYCNQKLAKMLDLPFEQIIGSNIDSVIYPDDIGLLKPILEKRSAKTESIVLRIIEKTEKVIQVRVFCVTLDFKKTYCCLVFVDLTAIKKIQTELK